MVVPFWLMLSTSVTSNVDSHDYRLVPKYLNDDEALFRKYVESAYNEDTKFFNYVAAKDIGDFMEISQPEEFPEAIAQDYDTWKKELPLTYLCVLHGFSITKPKISLMGAHLYQKFLAERYENDIELLNAAYREDFEHFDLQVPSEMWYLRLYNPIRDLRFNELQEFKSQVPSHFLVPAPVEGVYREFLTNKYDTEPETFAARYNDPSITHINDLTIPRRLPTNPQLAEDWEEYVRSEVPYQFIRFEEPATAAWRAFLRENYMDDFSLLQRVHGEKSHYAKLTGFEQVQLPQEPPQTDAEAADLGGFMEEAAPIAYVVLDTPELRYREWLAGKYNSIEALNQTYATNYDRFDRVLIPALQADWWYLQNERRAIRTDFLVRNYRDVIAYITLHGRALYVTLLFVSATVFLTLTVNPLAAYALSRYKLPSTYKILLFCLATMAFPPEVTAIPNFLLMKQLHLLNTLWALILPGAAAGFAIFLLKGFFDGLPQELYEAAEIDGASEFTLFTRICIPMSTPVLAVIGLGAFTSAYGSFLWAFVVCQDRNWWTLMVWLQQMQSWAPQSMIFAALVLAAIPTLIVFIFAQDVIMRGVIIPIEK